MLSDLCQDTWFGKENWESRNPNPVLHYTGGSHLLEQCISNFNLYANDSGVLLKCMIPFSRFGVGQKICISNKIPEHPEADLEITLGIVRTEDRNTVKFLHWLSRSSEVQSYSQMTCVHIPVQLYRVTVRLLNTL